MSVSMPLTRDFWRTHGVNYYFGRMLQQVKGMEVEILGISLRNGMERFDQFI